MAADIHALEIEFAKNPTLEACIPLCEAYLSQKRFMEAMVVCKKGIKQAPQDARGRVLLARVYSSQGKLPKAQAELEQILREMPGNPLGLEALGRLLVEQGRRNEGLAMLQQALAVDPMRPEARAILQQAGISVPTAAAVPAAAVPAGGAMPAPGARAGFAPAPQVVPPGMPPHLPAPGGIPGVNVPSGRSGFGQPAAPGFGATAFQLGQAPAQAPIPPPEPVRAPLEHVHDFFAPDTLGFSNESSEIETAGPGRLTILGFVPKNTGSIKTFFFIAVAALAVAGAVIVYQARQSTITREINKRYGEIKAAVDEDKFGRYEDALRRANEILALDSGHNQTLGAISYVYAVYAVDYKRIDALLKAKDFLRRAMAASKEETEFRVAARALIAYAEGQYEQGIADVRKIIDRGGSSPLVELEAFRLMAAARPSDKDTQTQLRRLVQSATSQARIFNFLGWYYYMQDDWQQADKNFASALQNVRGHPRALVGSALTDFDRGLALQERQKEIAASIRGVLSLPAEDLDPSVLALGQFARGQLLQWQGNQREAEEAFAQAFRLDPENPLLFYRRGTGLLNLGRAAAAVEFLRKAAARQPNNVRYYRTLADAQIHAGDTASAQATLERASQLAPADPELKVLTGDRLRAEKKWMAAVDAYKLVKREDGGQVLTRAALGVSTALREAGKKAEAVKYMEDFLANAPADVMQPEQAKLWCELGLNYEAMRNREAAERWFTQGIDTFRYEPNCHYYLCRLLGRGEDAKEACKLYVTLSPRGEFAEDAKKRAGMK